MEAFGKASAHRKVRKLLEELPHIAYPPLERRSPNHGLVRSKLSFKSMTCTLTTPNNRCTLLTRRLTITTKHSNPSILPSFCSKGRGTRFPFFLSPYIFFHLRIFSGPLAIHLLFQINSFSSPSSFSLILALVACGGESVPSPFSFFLLLHPSLPYAPTPTPTLTFN